MGRKDEAASSDSVQKAASFMGRKDEAASSDSAHKASPASKAQGAHPESRLKVIPFVALALFVAAAVVAVVAVCARAGTTGKQASTGMPAAGPYEAVSEDMEAGGSAAAAAKPEATPLLDEPMGGMADRSLMEPSDIDKFALEQLRIQELELEQQRIQELELTRSAAALKAAEIAANSAAKSENVATKSLQAAASLPADSLDVPSAASAAVPPHMDARGAPSMEAARPAGASPKPVEEVPKGRACCGPKCAPCGK